MFLMCARNSKASQANFIKNILALALADNGKKHVTRSQIIQLSEHKNSDGMLRNVVHAERLQFGEILFAQ